MALATSPIEPLGKYLVVQRAKPAETTEGGIVLPDQAKPSHDYGYVVAAGGECPDLPRLLHMPVLFRAWAGTLHRQQGVQFVILHLDDVLGILHNTEGIGR